ncbi:peptide ABC transporter ATPase [Ureibacillus sp. 179-F W5.1 NHS]|uniref:Peptide ABC transporter ATPase n=1 Tax=Lysinibacillus halotolerans TaxID=1368476 RepID=A0A3M8HAV0_9BACI|nr:peptide ABC transporter ATPase [Lysinibacillus halotolerans]RNC99384.1 peptide ABC transporter ATPase [Lysinibacillus halotolerans]
MKTYEYIHPENIEYTGEVAIREDKGETIAHSRRVYKHFFQRIIDSIFDYRYFLKYDVVDTEGKQLFTVKKISRRGKLWFEGYDIQLNKKYVISYENWRIGIPTLYITDGDIKIQLEKEMEDWSKFIYNDQVIAEWKAEYMEDQFHMVLHIHDQSPIQKPEFFIAICQATLFVGA